MQSLFKSFIVAMLIALPSVSLGQETYSLAAGGGEQPMTLLTNFAEDVARGDLVGGFESGTNLFSMAAIAVASDPGVDDGYLTAEQIVRLYLEAYPKDPLYYYFKDGGGKVLIKSFSWGAAYWSYHWQREIHFDNSWADTEENRKEAVRHLRNHLLEMADESGSAINDHLASWDGDIIKFLDKMVAAGIPTAAIFSPKQMNSAQLERLNEGIVNSVKYVPYFGGYVMTFELASGQVLSFTVYGERELTTTEKWVIIGTPAAGYVAGILAKVGGKWVFRQLTKRTDDLIELAPRGTLLASRTGGSKFTGNIDDVVEELSEIVPGITHKFDDLGDPKLAGVFDDVDNIIRFSDDVDLGVVTLADEMQHALDFAQTGLTKADIIKEIIEVHKIGPNAAYGWYHRRIFTRAIKNIHEGKPGFRHLKDNIGEIYDAYLGHGGELTMKQILETTFKGLF